MKSSTQTLLSLNRQNNINNELRKKKKEILDIVYTELRKIDQLNKQISKKLENKYYYYKKVQKFDKTYQELDTHIDDLILEKQNLEDDLSDFLKNNKDYTNYVTNNIKRIRPNSEPLSYGTPESFGGGKKIRRVKKRLPDGNTYITYEYEDSNSPSIVKWFPRTPNSPQLVNSTHNIDTGFNNEHAFDYQSPLQSHTKPIIPIIPEKRKSLINTIRKKIFGKTKGGKKIKQKKTRKKI